MRRQTGQRVLLVDDEASVLFAIKEYLTVRGHDVQSAGDRETAERLLHEDEFTCAVTDLHLTPSRSAEGLSIVRLARQRGAQRIVLLTAHGTPEILSAAEDLGADRVIAKPVPLNELERVLLGPAGELS